MATIGSRRGAVSRTHIFLIALFLAALAGLWLWKVWIPRQELFATTQLCFGNQKIWRGAVEMYRLDQKLTPAEHGALVFNARMIAELIAMGYNDSEDECPVGGWAYYKLLTVEPFITCAFHGPVDGPGPRSATPPRVVPPSPQPLPRAACRRWAATATRASSG